MLVLYAVFVLSLLAILWTAFAVARHLRRHEAHRDTQADVLERPLHEPVKPEDIP